ncbi:hypothetical protein JZ751_026991 [Albula glossodonta]|uniref:Short transient receptor potential channel 4-associated protein n=1 Tax=Albula glossodonta TaxID=121402 RepID=A0A8T2N0S6_9TELE|nr:hypothetical protein JZ751_026991 [Albula glossodonta]
MATSSGSEFSRIRGARKGQSGNILIKIRQSHVTGRGMSRGTQKLHQSSHPNSDLTQAHEVLKAMSFVTEDRKAAQQSGFPSTYTFHLFGGIDLLVEILMRPTLTTQKKSIKMNDNLVKDCLSVLYNCCICTEGVTKNLAARKDFVLFLFTLMANKKTCLQTATLIEDILGVRKEMIRLEEVPNLAALVQSFDQQQLANFCRILSVTISEPDLDHDDKHTLLAKNAQQCSTNPSRAETNQVTLLNIPGFVERLCKLATRKVSEVTGTSNFLQELEDWYSWLDNALVLNALMQMASEEAEQSSTESSDESTLAASPLRHRLPQSMKMVHEIMYKVEVLYVLCVLLMGQQRNQVHRMLAEFRLIPGLNNLFDKLIWRKYTTSNHILHGQNQNCDCSPEISFKIQFLRLLQSFSDHHERLVCDGKKGLLTRLLTVMKREPPDSSFRFWQARAVESFLRGTTSYADQIFLLKRGLLEHILSCIIDSGCRSRDVLQSYFDLLGELMKFNIDAFRRFNKYVNSEEKFQVFLTQINSSLVDSNMLVRCIVLSLDRFQGQMEDIRVVEVMSECCLLSYMSRMENRLSFLFRLINIINENVSCLNTSLVVLMLARRKGKLPCYLSALRTKEHAERYPGCLLNNFHNLLYWKETVSVLLGPDHGSACAISSYIDEAYRELEPEPPEDHPAGPRAHLSSLVPGANAELVDLRLSDVRSFLSVIQLMLDLAVWFGPVEVSLIKWGSGCSHPALQFLDLLLSTLEGDLLGLVQTQLQVFDGLLHVLLHPLQMSTGVLLLLQLLCHHGSLGQRSRVMALRHSCTASSTSPDSTDRSPSSFFFWFISPVFCSSADASTELTRSVASSSSCSASLRARSFCSSSPRCSSTSAASSMFLRSVTAVCSFSSSLWCSVSSSSSCRWRTSFWDSAAWRLAWLSWISISFRSPSIFFLSLTASLRDRASASSVVCIDSSALWWLRLGRQGERKEGTQ